MLADKVELGLCRRALASDSGGSPRVSSKSKAKVTVNHLTLWLSSVHFHYVLQDVRNCKGKR